jgi:predicted adenylyl cyclase CyaB
VDERASTLADSGPVTFTQDDTFFSCNSGRLKLRTFGDGKGELIFYRRPDQAGPKESFYHISPVTDSAAIRETLTLAYGQTGRVRKTRILFLAGRTRIQLDRVEGLGEFLELEVMLDEGENHEAGKAVALELMEKLGIQSHQLIEDAYVDMLAGTTETDAAPKQ